MFYQQITKLKIDYNPFAKGFRDSGSAKRDKRYFFNYFKFVKQKHIYKTQKLIKTLNKKVLKA